jgi:hypothetical protein
MPNCHQCNQDASTNARTGNCSICLAQAITLCARCSMWELGPNTTVTNIFTDLATSPQPQVVSVQRQHSGGSSNSNSSSSQLPLDCDLFFPAIGDACDVIKAQLDESVVGPGPFGTPEPE